MKKTILLLITAINSLGAFSQTLSDVVQPENLYDYFFLEAMVERQRGNSDAAFDLLTHCVDINPNAPEAYYYLAQYYHSLKDQDKAQEYLKKAAALSPDNAIFLETLAQSHISKREYDDATVVIEQLYKHHLDRDDLLETLFQLYQQQKEYEKAIDILNRIERMDGKSERTAFAKSQIYTQMGNKKAAIAEMAALAKKYPNDMNYLDAYADLLLVNDQEDKAMDIYERILKDEPDNVRTQLSLLAYYKIAEDSVMAEEMTEQVLMNKNATTDQKVYLLRQKIGESEDEGGDSTRVLQLFHKMLDVPAPDPDIASLCAAYMGLKKMPRDSVQAMLEKILTVAPDNASARLQLVSYAWSDKNMDRVIELCQAARLYNPDEMAFYYYQGMAYYLKDDKQNALSAFQNGIGVINDESNPEIVSDFYAVLGDLLHQEGKEQEAYAAYDSCLVWKADHVMCLNNYAYYLSLKGEQLDKAEQMSYKAIKADPKNANNLDTYAWILFMQKRYSEAKIYIEQALQNDTDSNAVIMEHAGDIYIMNKDVDRALACWQDALQKIPEKENKILTRKIKLKKYIKE